MVAATVQCIQRSLLSPSLSAFTHLRRLLTMESKAGCGSLAGLFQGHEHAKAYAAFRPSYPKALYECVFAYCGQGGTGTRLAVDIACGPGNGTIPLAEHFDHVIGVDISQAQIDQARKDLANVEFRVGAAEDLAFLAEGSVDLIACAQGLHWMDRGQVYSEARRVLCPRGAFIAYGYGLCSLNSPTANALLLKFYSETLHGWWDKERRMVDNKYQDIKFPFDDVTRNEEHMIEREMSIGDFVRYLSTWSAWNKLLKAHPDSALLRQLEQVLSESLVQDKMDGPLKVTFPVFLLMGRT